MKQHDKIIILGSGQSLDDFEQPDSSWTIIAVNNSIRHKNVKNVDYWFTLDLSEQNLEIIFDDSIEAEKVVAYSPDPRIDQYCYRKVAHRATILKRMVSLEKIHGICCRLKFSENPNEISTGNSLYGALNLAYHMNPKVVIISGLDANNEAKFDGQHSKNLNHLPHLFDSCILQLAHKKIFVINACKDSGVDSFKRCSFKESINIANKHLQAIKR